MKRIYLRAPKTKLYEPIGWWCLNCHQSRTDAHYDLSPSFKRVLRAQQQEMNTRANESPAAGLHRRGIYL